MTLLHPRTYLRLQRRGRVRRILVGTALFIGIEQGMHYLTHSSSHPINWATASIGTGTLWGLLMGRLRAGVGYGSLFGTVSMPLYMVLASGEANKWLLYTLERHFGVQQAGDMARQLEKEQQQRREEEEEEQPALLKWFSPATRGGEETDADTEGPRTRSKPSVPPTTTISDRA
eukprot:gb/GECG01013793.1/.p1 GENE.gb/GECG01013793.1/~~gb/GECG01013793.1/.p1  ORF type:complete len:174 (+),score=14.79 gb/GECG01013793.1/:1-522(+)